MIRRVATPAALLLTAVGLGACATTGVSTTKFTGDSHDVAQAISNFQSDAQAHDGTKVCNNDLAADVVAKLNATGTKCATAINNQLTEVDTFTLSVTDVQVNTTTTPPTATARIKSSSGGKDRFDTLKLVKEGTSWKIASQVI